MRIYAHLYTKLSIAQGSPEMLHQVDSNSFLYPFPYRRKCNFLSKRLLKREKDVAKVYTINIFHFCTAKQLLELRKAYLLTLVSNETASKSNKHPF